MATASAFVRNVSINYLGIIVRAVVFVLLTPFVVHRLGSTVYGVWTLVHTIAFYLKFLDLGLYSALVKYLAEYSANGRKDDINNLIANTLGAFLIAGLIALVASTAIAAFLVPVFHQVPEDLVPIFQIAIILFGIDLLISFPGSVCNGIFEGFQRYDILNYTGTVFIVVRGVGTLVLLTLGYGLIALAVLEIISSIFGIAVDILIIRKLFPDVSLSFKFFDTHTWKQVREYSLWSSLNEILVEGGGGLDTVLIPFFLSISLVTPYTIVCTLAALLFVIVEPLANVLFPLASEHDARGDYEGMHRLLILSTKAVLAITVPAAIVLSSMGEPIIDMWIGSEYVDLSPMVLKFVVVSFMVSVLFMPATTMLAGIAKLKEIFVFSIIETVLAVMLVSVTVSRYELVGLAASCAIANFIISFGCILPLTCKSFCIPAISYMREGLIKPLIPAIPGIVAANVLTHIWYPEGWISLAMEGCLIYAICFTGFYFLAISKSDRALFVYQAKQILSS